MAKSMREIKEIQQEYNQRRFDLGVLEWELEKIPKQIEDVKRQLRTLDHEADEAQRAQVKKEQAKIQTNITKKKETSNGSDGPIKIDQGEPIGEH
jgi:chromosome segregation ATPase